MSDAMQSGEGWAMYRGDCLDIMAGLDRVDHVITDAPYEKEACTKARRALKDATQKKGAVNTGEVRRIDQPLEIFFAPITEADRLSTAVYCARLARRWVITFCQAEGISAWRSVFESAGLQWVRAGVWRKPNGAPQFTGDRPGQGWEALAIAHQPGRKRWNGGGKHGVWHIPLDHRAGGKGKNSHPTRKPARLMEALVLDFTDPDEWVLDPYAGSGSTGVACLIHGRCFVGIERDPKYFDIACERLRDAAAAVAATRTA